MTDEVADAPGGAGAADGDGAAASRAARARGERRARGSLRLMRDTGSAGIVGGATVALTLMLGGLPVTQGVFVALDVMWGLLIVAGGLFAWDAARAQGAHVPAPAVATELFPGAAIVLVGIGDGFRGQWPIEPHTGGW